MTTAPHTVPSDATAAAAMLTAQGVVKDFFGNRVLHGVDLALRAGEVHGLVGENGAGKSTLMKILAGVHQPDAGQVLLDGEPIRFHHPVAATAAGIVTVFQEFNLLPDRTVAQNVFLGREPRKAGLVSTRAMEQEVSSLLDDLGISGIDPGQMVGTLTVAEQQIVEIVKALSFHPRVISMDEPTAALADHEVELLYGIIARLKARGVAILYVSHRLKEIFDLCDRITVLKDGALVHSGPTSALDTESLVRLMVGRSISTFFPPRPAGASIGEVRLQITEGGNAFIDGVNLTVRAGEIVGLAGLQGSGRTELAEAIFGAVPLTRGQITLDGTPTSIRSPRAAIKAGIALVTEDRKQQGLALNQTVLDNVLMVVNSVFPGRARAARRNVPELLAELEVRSRSGREATMEVQYLSGGNQQKVVLGKWLSTSDGSLDSGPRVLLLDEPTRGIDVGAKVAAYDLIRRLAANGIAILMISSELPEVIGLADRIAVLHDGRLVAELPAGSSEEAVLAAATGHSAPANLPPAVEVGR